MKKIKNIIVLAGGDSGRFWPLKEKLLTPFLGKSLIKLESLNTKSKSSENLWYFRQFLESKVPPLNIISFPR